MYWLCRFDFYQSCILTWAENEEWVLKMPHLVCHFIFLFILILRVDSLHFPFVHFIFIYRETSFRTHFKYGWHFTFSAIKLCCGESVEWIYISSDRPTNQPNKVLAHGNGLSRQINVESVCRLKKSRWS